MITYICMINPKCNISYHFQIEWKYNENNILELLVSGTQLNMFHLVNYFHSKIETGIEYWLMLQTCRVDNIQ